MSMLPKVILQTLDTLFHGFWATFEPSIRVQISHHFGLCWPSLTNFGLGCTLLELDEKRSRLVNAQP